MNYPMNYPMKVSDEVTEAIKAGMAVVALESTIISHGMPWPQNVETALSIEALVREGGAVPATIVLMEGSLVVGLSTSQIEAMGRKGRDVVKVSRRDMPLILAKREMGATTVSATMIAAARAGIHVFVTGGLGGVHRGWQGSMDISADLREFSRSPVCVVCAGAKAILDLPATMEYLETEGIPVLGFETDELPAFYSRRSGIALQQRVDNCEQAARAWLISRSIFESQGMIIACPVPEDDEIHETIMGEHIGKALEESRSQGIRGKDVTPFLLARVCELTGGESLKANIALVRNNARIGTELACAIAELLRNN
ncbi:MAG: pseudouridine-5-phosphate glycosidase [Candidatus Wallbacteria bacterium HGW-Wallbacteria-1]|jgi:pseudouridine-5'-phosphate glycosidase|uniref:Pseudouridine-5'-phosphate glycosidase n=1 Tax=Candidatus Wallbacteria bacterium HGW-Wallbacteria-1 TaxID=2013854 RepID=A0A2N1PLP7_9BACT|nr:MAG: pseudouridine-5-phosphate glycosidase [Candidatus Wallbacteria bacterium HGW-Wallbacteria-1]